jgi:hypothetical protein
MSDPMIGALTCAAIAPMADPMIGPMSDLVLSRMAGAMIGPVTGAVLAPVAGRADAALPAGDGRLVLACFGNTPAEHPSNHAPPA